MDPREIIAAAKRLPPSPALYDLICEYEKTTAELERIKGENDEKKSKPAKTSGNASRR